VRNHCLARSLIAAALLVDIAPIWLHVVRHTYGSTFYLTECSADSRTTEPPFKSLKPNMSSMSALTLLVPVFDGQNWTLWSKRMELFFLAQKLWWVVMTPRESCTGGKEATSSIASAPSQAAPQAPTSGGEAPATVPLAGGSGAHTSGAMTGSSGGSAAVHAMRLHQSIGNWDEANQQAMGYICLCVGPAFIQDLKAKRSAGEQWASLEEEYGDPSIITIYNNFKAALDIRIKAGVHPAQPLALLRGYFNKLAERQVHVPEFIQVMITLTKLPPSYNIFTQVIQMDAAQAGSKGHDLKIKNVHAAIIQTFEAPSSKNKDNGQANKVTAIKQHTGTPTFQQQHQQQRPSSSSADSSAQNSGRGRGNGRGRERGRVHCGTRAGKQVREKSQQDTSHVANVVQDFPERMAVDGPRDKRMHRPVSTLRNVTIPHTELWRAINLLKR
jgi:hypothetical protein